MQEIRLELDESKLNGIIMELDVLHRAVAPEIVEFYGAFTIESCVYYCMEYMDAGSLDTLTGGGVPLADAKAEEGEEGCALRVPEPVLRRITAAMVRGLKFLKDEPQIMHRGKSLGYKSGNTADGGRCQADERANQQEGRSQVGGLRCIRTAGEESGKDKYRLSILHGCEYFSLPLPGLALMM